MEEWMHWQDSVDERIITITIHSIENVLNKENISVSFTVEHNAVILGESNPTFVRSIYDEGFSVFRIDFAVNLPVLPKDKESLNSIVSSPVLKTNEEERSSILNVEVRSKNRSIFSAKSAAHFTPELLGMCNLDLIPIALGEESFTEKLILETPTFSYDGTLVSWQNLPRLTVTVCQYPAPLFQLGEMNFLNVTIESIYNPPDSFTADLKYKVGTIAYIDNEVPENVFFDNGIWTTSRDVERTKRWNTLRHIENRAQLSKYKLDCDFVGVRNPFKKQFHLAKQTCEDIKRIEWNSLNRCVLWKTGIEAMKNHITKYKYWPFQFEVSTETATEKSKNRKDSLPTIQLYQCYVDLSELLFPGRRNCRIVGQLYTYNPMDMSEKVGLENNIFIMEVQRKEVKEKEKKIKTPKQTQSVQSERGTTASTAIITETGEPTIIVIEVELYEALFACRIEEDFSNMITDIIPDIEKKQYYVYSSSIAEAQYVHCIQKLAEVITESYRDFCDENIEKDTNEEKREEKYCFDPESDEVTCFTQYLYKNGVYQSICSTLRLKIPMLIDQKFDMPKNLVDSNKTHNFISSVYTFLVEQMHVALNKMVEGRCTQDLQSEINSKLLYFYAEEAYEFGDMEKAKQYYTEVIMSDKRDPYPWTQYAIFLRKIGDVNRATECCLEAITLDRQYATVLLVYAMILFESRDYKGAEIFLRAITDFHPRFFEGWAILHLFYLKTEYYAGLALAEEMSNSDRSIHILYYMAVEHYLSGRYEDALSHLEEARCNYGMDYSISSLMGHCHFKMGDTEKAVECCEFARMLFDRPNDLHLVEVRLGFHYNNDGEFDRARNIFLTTCRTSPTSLTWLGVGISFYELNQFLDAEVCLSEANRIDNCNPEIWAYLCLLNMTLKRYDEFSQCYAEMIKNNLKNRKLLLRITNLMEALDYTPPNLTETSELIEEHSTDGSEERFEN
ncbi:Tetratricopeptide repeat protein 18 [Habropoda laboriosa]|uniref:Tetratricopeptide repeat protein 18 n=1 Tax=Habropoda laboriosa TaxID=597456 RepID=A0A0L7R5Z7_9HYME|nr:Tetratricopeptide repeat protein 18 [Habropoda laboriosa]